MRRLLCRTKIKLPRSYSNHIHQYPADTLETKYGGMLHREKRSMIRIRSIINKTKFDNSDEDINIINNNIRDLDEFFLITVMVHWGQSRGLLFLEVCLDDAVHYCSHGTFLLQGNPFQ